MNWINFLHLYQPPTQSRALVEKVTHESYRLILDLLARFPQLKFTLNISGSLLELWEKYNLLDVADAYRRYVQEGRLELVGSACYHPILPLIPVSFQRAQIEQQALLGARFFGAQYKPSGFYLPEMAYSREVAEQIAALGFAWLILDEIHAPAHLTRPLDTNVKYKITGLNLNVVFRSRAISKTFPPEYVVNHLATMPEYLITAHDGELYGHWHRDDQGYYEKAFTHPAITTSTVSAYLNGLNKVLEVEPRKANWESLDSELVAGLPFALWHDPKNQIQQKLWQLAHFAMTHATQSDTHAFLAQAHLHRGLASCAWWWASERKLGPFSPLAWNPDEIQKGAHELLMSIRTQFIVPTVVRIEAEELYVELIKNIWVHHWKIYG